MFWDYGVLYQQQLRDGDSESRGGINFQAEEDWRREENCNRRKEREKVW